jgi:hypothetical protein
MAPSKTELANAAALQESQQLLNLWLQTKGFLAKAFTDTPVAPEEEKAFLETKSAVSQYTRLVSQKLPSDVKIGGERMQELLRQAISIGHLRGLPKSDKQTLVANWHASFVSLARAVGCLQLINEGYKPTEKAAKTGTGLKDLRGGPKKKSREWGGTVKLILALAAIAGAIWYLMNQ